MGLENRLSRPSKEKTARGVVVTLIFAVPVAGLIARREMSLRKAERQRIIDEDEGNNNSGDFDFGTISR